MVIVVKQKNTNIGSSKGTMVNDNEILINVQRNMIPDAIPGNNEMELIMKWN